MTRALEAQLNAIVTDYDAAVGQSRHDDASDVLTRTQVAEMRTRCIAAIERASGPSSTYYKSVMDVATRKDNEWNHLGRQIGVAKALLSDIQNDYLKSYDELLHGEVFSDFLEMASHLLEHNYKDAAAVLTGGTLEIHIRNLCGKHGVNVSLRGKPKKSDELNAQLRKINVYSKLDQKNVTAWLDLRNSAAHGNYSEYTKDQVQLFVASVRDFIARYPA